MLVGASVGAAVAPVVGRGEETAVGRLVVGRLVVGILVTGLFVGGKDVSCKRDSQS